MQPWIVAPGEGRDFGFGMICRIPSASTGGAYCAIEQTLAPGEGIDLHVHSGDDETYYILEGRLDMQCGERAFSAETGAMVHVPRTVPHAFRNRSQAPVRFLNVFTPGGFDELVAELRALSPEDAADSDKRDAIRAKYGIRFLRSAGG
jgi:mannose-6-phosphate isomerase-like protein (cupin superfamily)